MAKNTTQPRKKIKVTRKKDLKDGATFRTNHGTMSESPEFMHQYAKYLDKTLTDTRLKLLKGDITDAHLCQVYRLSQQGLSVEHIAHSLGLFLDQFYALMHKHEKLKWAALLGRPHAQEFVTNQLWQHIRKGNLTAIMFYLRTRGGWSEKFNLQMINESGLGDQPDDAAEQMNKLSTEELKTVIDILQKADSRMALGKSEGMTTGRPRTVGLPEAVKKVVH